MIGVGQFMVLNSIVNLSNDWYSPSERIFMTSLACFFSFGGLAVGFVLPNLQGIDGNNKTDMALARHQIETSLYQQAIIFTPLLITLVL